MLENIENAITRLPMDRLGQNLGGRIQPTPLPHNFFLGIGRYQWPVTYLLYNIGQLVPAGIHNKMMCYCLINSLLLLAYLAYDRYNTQTA